MYVAAVELSSFRHVFLRLVFLALLYRAIFLGQCLQCLAKESCYFLSLALAEETDSLVLTIRLSNVCSRAQVNTGQ